MHATHDFGAHNTTTDRLDGVLLVFASKHCDPTDNIRSYDDFMKRALIA